MKKLSLPSNLKEKIYDTKWNQNQVQITSYFPLMNEEKSKIHSTLDCYEISFKSIFSDSISESEWVHTKNQIIKKFQDELLDIE